DRLDDHGVAPLGAALEAADDPDDRARLGDPEPVLDFVPGLGRDGRRAVGELEREPLAAPLGRPAAAVADGVTALDAVAVGEPVQGLMGGERKLLAVEFAEL